MITSKAEKRKCKVETISENREKSGKIGKKVDFFRGEFSDSCKELVKLDNNLINYNQVWYLMLLLYCFCCNIDNLQNKLLIYNIIHFIIFLIYSIILFLYKDLYFSKNII